MVSNGIWKNAEVLGGKIPKKLGDPIRIRDEELNRQVEEMYKIFNENIQNGNWNLIDYKNFRGEIAKVNIDLFKKAYPFIISLIKLPKDNLEIYCRHLDETFSLYIYHENQEKEFSTKDVALVVRGILSKLAQYSNLVANWYDKNSNTKNNIEQIIVDLQLLLDKLNNNDQDLINFILNRYSEFLMLAGDDEALRETITLSFEEVIDANKRNLNRKIKYYCASCDRKKAMIPNDVLFESVTRCKMKKLS